MTLIPLVAFSLCRLCPESEMGGFVYSHLASCENGQCVPTEMGLFVGYRRDFGERFERVTREHCHQKSLFLTLQIPIYML